MANGIITMVKVGVAMMITISVLTMVNSFMNN